VTDEHGFWKNLRAPRHKGSVLDARRACAIAHARRAWGCRDFVVAADPIEAYRVHVYEAWESEEARIALRGDGPGDAVSSSLVKAEVAKHVVASSEPA